MQIIVDGMLTHYERAGKGKVVLLLPGWADTSTSWQPFQQIMSQKFDVIVLDMPGFGGTQQPSTAWNLENYVEFIQQFLDKLGVKKIYAIIGHSNGGAMAMRALGTSRVQSEKLVLVASAGIRNVQQGKKGALRVLAKTGKVLSKPLPKSAHAKLRARLYTSIGSDMLVAEHMQETFKNIVGDDVQNDAKRVSVPTLLVYGDKDHETPPRYGEMLSALIKNSKHTILSGADHFVHVHQTAELADICREFLR